MVIIIGNKKVKIILIASILIAITICVLITLITGNKRIYSIDAEPVLVYNINKNYDKPINNYQTLLCDKQAVQFPSAKRLGVIPMDNPAKIDSLIDAGRLVKVPNSKYLWVKADYPYLIPEVYDMLLEIGRRYQEKVGGHQHLRVTSCLRTRESIKNLQKWNQNSIKNSCHLYGTTFDISYAYMSDNQKEALARVLKDMRDAGYIHTLYEVNQPCFHITMRKAGDDTSAK